MRSTYPKNKSTWQKLYSNLFIFDQADRSHLLVINNFALEERKGKIALADEGKKEVHS